VCWRWIEAQTNGHLQEENFAKGCNQVVIAVQEKGWMDTEGMKLWIDKFGVYGAVDWSDEEACLFLTRLKLT